MPLVVVTSPSFSRHPVLTAELRQLGVQLRLWEGEGVPGGAELRDHLRGAEVAVVGQERIDAALLDALPGLRMVAKYGVGLDNIDLAACEARGVVIGWTAGVNARSVAELSLGFLLGLFHNVFLTSNRLRQGIWWKRGGAVLSGKTVGIVGLGFVGRELVTLLAPLGCRVLGNDIADRDAFAARWGVELVGKDRLFVESDAVSLHVPLTAETRGLVDAARLSSMKPGAYLVNTARGAVVDEAALRVALEGGHIAGAALDVFEQEPPTDAALLTHERLVGTPHIGGNSEEAVLAMGRAAIAWVERDLRERPGPP